MLFLAALIPSTLSSFISVLILQAIYQRPFGAFFTFHNNLPIFTPTEMLAGAVLGCIGGLVGLVYFLLYSGYGAAYKRLRLERFKWFMPLVGWVVFSVAGMMLPAILFWGEPDFQNIVDENTSPLYHWRGNSSGIFNLATVEGERYAPVTIFLIAFVKLLVLPFSLTMNITGGLVFPLFFIGGSLGQVVHMLTGIDQAMAVCCVMAASQASVTRTPFASTFVAVFNSQGSVSQLFVPVLVASFLGMLLTYKTQTFPAQRPRDGEEEQKEKEKFCSLIFFEWFFCRPVYNGRNPHAFPGANCAESLPGC